MAAIDLANFREYDLPSKLTVTSSSVSFSGVSRNEDVWVYESRGYHDFVFEFDFQVSATGSGSLVNLCGCGNLIDDSLAQTEYVYARTFYNGTNYTTFVAADNGVIGTQITISPSTRYYCRLTKVGTSATYQIYTDSGRTSLLGTSSGTLASDYFYKYLFVVNSYNSGTASTSMTGDVSNVTQVLDYPLEILSIPHKFDSSTFTIEGYGPSNATINWVNNTNSDSGSVLTNDLGKWEVTGSADVGANSLTISSSGETDQNLTVTRVADQGFTSETATVDTSPTYDFPGAFHSSNYFEGLYQITAYQYELNGDLRYKLGKDVGAGLAFKDGGVAPSAVGGNLTSVDTGNWSFQDTFYAAWHNGRWAAKSSVFSQVILDDDTTYDFTSRISTSYYILIPNSSQYESISQHYAIDGYTFISAFYRNISGTDYIRTYRSDDLTTGGSVTLQDEINLGSTGTTNAKVELFGFSNSDIALIWTDETAGTLNYKYYDKSTTTWGSTQQVSNQITDITAFRAVGCDSDQLFFFYLVNDDLKMRIRSGGVGGTLSGEVDLINDIGAFSVTTDNGKDNSIQVHVQIGYSIYTLQVLNNTPDTLPVLVTTEAFPRTFSSPYTAATQAGILYQTPDNELQVTTVNIERQRRSADTTIFIGYARPDYSATDLITLVDTGFEQTAILTSDIDGTPKLSTYNHLTESFDYQCVPVYNTIWDYHNVPKITLQQGGFIWFASGGRQDSSVGTNLPIDLFQSDLEWDNPSFDPANFTQLSGFTPSGRGYKDILVNASGIAFLIYMVVSDLYIRKYESGSWDSGTHIYDSNYTGGDYKRMYWHGSQFDSSENIDIHINIGEDFLIPVTASGSVLTAKDDYIKVTYAGAGSYTAVNTLGSSVTLPAVFTDTINTIYGADTVTQYGLTASANWFSVPDRTASTAYIAGDIVGFDNFWWTCTVGGTSSTDTSPSPTVAWQGTYVDGTVTWRKDGTTYSDTQYIGHFDSRSATIQSDGNGIYTKSFTSTADIEVTTRISVFRYTDTNGWEEIEVIDNSVDTLYPRPVIVKDKNDTLYVFYLKSVGGLPQYFFQKSDDDGVTWTSETKLRTSNYAQREIIVRARDTVDGDISASYTEDVSQYYGETVLIESVLAPSVRATSIKDQLGNPVPGGNYQIDGDAGAYVVDEVVEVASGTRLITANPVSGYTAPDPFNVEVPTSGILDFTITYQKIGAGKAMVQDMVQDTIQDMIQDIA